MRLSPRGFFNAFSGFTEQHFLAERSFLVKSNKIEVNFGNFVALRAQLVYEKQLNNQVLKFYLAPWMSKEQCQYTAQIIYSILEKIKLSFFNKSKGKTILAASLLFPSSTRSGEHLADSDYLQQCLKDREEFIYPDPMTAFTRVPLNEYTTWLNKSAQPVAKVENKKNRESPRLKKQRQSPIEEYFQFLRSIPLPRFLRVNAFQKKEQKRFLKDTSSNSPLLGVTTVNKVLLLYGSEHTREEEISFNFQCQLNSLGVLVHRLGFSASTKTKVITSSTKD